MCLLTSKRNFIKDISCPYSTMGLLCVGLLPQRTQLQKRTARIILCADYTTPSSDNNNNNNKKTVDPIFLLNITRTCLYNFDALQPHFYIVKLGLKGVYIIFLISAQKHRLWYSLEPPSRGGSNGYPQSMF